MYYKLGIDCLTKGKKVLIHQLKKLKTTISIIDGGLYHMDKLYSQIHIDTEMTIDELDNWLYNRNSGGLWEPIGTYSRNEYQNELTVNER